tara:strand:- start:789 stop:2147 length:1359 start_codon:yes stop_codon:yes gene_type:complete
MSLTVEEAGEAEEQFRRIKELAQQEEEILDDLPENIEVKKLLVTDYVMSEVDELALVSKTYSINASEARKMLDVFPKQYIIHEQTVPELVKKMRSNRRELKGSLRENMSKAIDVVIDAYSEHLEKSIDSIFWLAPYKQPFRKMRFTEKDLSRLNKMKDIESRRGIVDSLCKYWEAELDREGMAYSKEYSRLSKEMSQAKKEFRECLKAVKTQTLNKSKKERQLEFIENTITKHQGITAKGIHEKMPVDMFNITNPNMISKTIRKLDVASHNGSYYKVPSLIKKNIWAYTAAFIDSDGYITLDRNMNPRVGLVATGERGKVFMKEMHKSIGFGRMHLDQKSPQDTRLINRLNFYSQADVSELLTKCLPHFRLKKGNAELLLELIRMKKSYKKADWYKSRCDEIFKLMKWENHKDHVGFDWLKEGIYLDDIQKYKDNCKMSVMDELENIGGILA